MTRIERIFTDNQKQICVSVNLQKIFNIKIQKATMEFCPYFRAQYHQLQ